MMAGSESSGEIGSCLTSQPVNDWPSVVVAVPPQASSGGGECGAGSGVGDGVGEAAFEDSKGD